MICWSITVGHVRTVSDSSSIKGVLSSYLAFTFLKLIRMQSKKLLGYQRPRSITCVAKVVKKVCGMA